MTICIAANCANGQAVVVASDRMLSAPFLTLEFDHPDAKIDEVSRTCVALSAGDALASHDVLMDGAGFAGQLQNPMISNFADQLRQKFIEARRRRASEQVLEPRGLSFGEFYQGGAITRLPPDLAMLLDSHIQQLQLDVSLILAGVDQTGAHIYSLDDPGVCACYDRIGYHAIGSGHRHALLTLVALGHHRTIDVNHGVFNVYCAKRAAEAAPGVGMATEIRVITGAGIQPLDRGFLDKLSPLYDAKMNPKIAEVETGINQLGFGKPKNGDGKASA